MEKFLEFKNRIYSFEKKSIADNLEEFIVNPKIADKINSDGSIKEFYGDTVVFELSESEKSIILKLQDILYSNCNDILSDRLPSETFHITLHDLNSNSNYKVIEDILIKSENDVKNVFDEISNINNNEPIIMKKSYIFNLVNTSIVLGLEPIDDENFSRLMCLYNKFEEVKELSYPLTPHITLAYFKNKNIGYKGIETLRKAIEEMNKYEVQINLKLKGIYYKHFFSMIKYKGILSINNK